MKYEKTPDLVICIHCSDVNMSFNITGIEIFFACKAMEMF